jgi:hypothetical protein
LDPKWQEFSASKRGRAVFVKMTTLKARVICVAWDLISRRLEEIDKGSLPSLFKDIGREVEASMEHNTAFVVYSIPVANCRRDVESLQRFTGQAQSKIEEMLVLFCEALEAGLKGDPRVDWIARCGGPTPDRREGITWVSPHGDGPIIILDERDLVDGS